MRSNKFCILPPERAVGCAQMRAADCPETLPCDLRARSAGRKGKFSGRWPAPGTLFNAGSSAAATFNKSKTVEIKDFIPAIAGLRCGR
jgi:hypothetical protein